MSTLRERLDADRSAQPLADHIGHHIAGRWQPLLDEHRDELEREFEKHADAAYRVYSRELLEPIRAELDELSAGGWAVQPPFPGSFRDSVEPPTSPAERVRTFWTVVSRDDEPVGTLLFRLFHDHSRFRVWREPQVMALRETSPEKIRAAIDRL